ncbi:MAG TPA: pitrilysin family protein [Terriglobia bacterium]|nr:pitrilysin family protein [Terriglobia bacterium]
MRNHRLRTLLFGVCLCAVPLAGVAGSRLPQVQFTDQKLDNGLRVIIVPDHTAPVFAISVTYKVGSRYERPGRTGFAHLFEHMMFEGSENVGKGEHFILVLNNGGNMNGQTTEDRTNYFEALPKNQLDLALYLESDRMRSLAVTQANLDNQRNAVQDERRLGIDNQPYGHAQLEIGNLAYDNFAYKHSVIGEMRDLDAASVDDVRNFFRIYYAPNNAVLTLVGDLDPAEALEQVKKYFGSIPSQPAPPAVDLTEPPHYGERSETLTDPLARLPLVVVAYHIPAGNTADNFAMQVLGDVLGKQGNQSSRLYQHLVKDKQLGAQVFAGADDRTGPSLLYLFAIVRPGVKPEECEKALIDEVAALQKDGITPAELAKAQAQDLHDQIQFVRQTDLSEATSMGEDTALFDDPNLVNTWVEKYNAVTADQVKAAAAKYLVTNERVVITDLPAPAQANQAAEVKGGK